MKKFLLVVLVFLVFLLLTGAVLHYGRQPEPFIATSVSASLLQPGPLKVKQYETVFIDRSRPTDANGDYAGAPERRLEGAVWHPSTKAHGPVPTTCESLSFIPRAATEC